MPELRLLGWSCQTVNNNNGESNWVGMFAMSTGLVLSFFQGRESFLSPSSREPFMDPEKYLPVQIAGFCRVLSTASIALQRWINTSGHVFCGLHICIIMFSKLYIIFFIFILKQIVSPNYLVCYQKSILWFKGMGWLWEDISSLIRLEIIIYR